MVYDDDIRVDISSQAVGAVAQFSCRRRYNFATQQTAGNKMDYPNITSPYKILCRLYLATDGDVSSLNSDKVLTSG